MKQLTKSNYYGKNANMQFLSVSQYKDFIGTIGKQGCEYKALAKLNGDYIQEPSKELLLGSYVDSAWDGSYMSCLTKQELFAPCIYEHAYCRIPC